MLNIQTSTRTDYMLIGMVGHTSGLSQPNNSGLGSAIGRSTGDSYTTSGGKI